MTSSSGFKSTVAMESLSDILFASDHGTLKGIFRIYLTKYSFVGAKRINMLANGLHKRISNVEMLRSFHI